MTMTLTHHQPGRVAPQLPVGAGLFAVPGLRGAGVATGVKPSGALDLALIVADEPMACAAMFTTSEAAAPPVHLCRETLAEHDAISAIVVNSGNANALTGRRGRADAEAMQEAVETHVGGPALVLSTGIIGVPLPIEKVLGGIQDASQRLSKDADASVAHGMMTTDTQPKTAAVHFELSGRRYTLGGVAKGSGMIHPNMATMLAVMATDAPVEPARLKGMLRHAVDRSFHEITVDGDTSTNDAVILLAARGSTPLAPEDDEKLQRAVTELARNLAGQIIEDGEGATRIMEINVRGARSREVAQRVAKAIATSSLVKTALAGGHPNWGRIVAAAGTAGVALDTDAVGLHMAGYEVLRRGLPLEVDEDALRTAVSGHRVEVTLDLGDGEHAGRMLTTDLTHRYVEINAEYTT